MTDKRVTIVLQTRVAVEDLATLVKYYYKSGEKSALQMRNVPKTRCALLTRAFEDFVDALVNNGLVERIDSVAEASELLYIFGMGDSNKGGRERFRGSRALNIAIEEELPTVGRNIVEEAEKLRDGGGTLVQQAKVEGTNKLLAGKITQEEYDRMVRVAQEEQEEQDRAAEERTQETIRQNSVVEQSSTDEQNEAIAKRKAKLAEDLAKLQNMKVVE